MEHVKNPMRDGTTLSAWRLSNDSVAYRLIYPTGEYGPVETDSLIEDGERYTVAQWVGTWIDALRREALLPGDGKVIDDWNMAFHRADHAHMWSDTSPLEFCGTGAEYCKSVRPAEWGA